MTFAVLERDAGWLERRRTGIGGSDIPILAGLSTFAGVGIHDLYLEKRGELEPRPSTPAMHIGNRMEKVVAELYTDETGNAVVRSNVLHRHPVYPWAIGNLDRKVRGQRRLLECKVRRWLPKAEGLPADVECQVQWYMGVTRYPVADVAILVAGTDFRIVEVKADEAYFGDLLVIAGDFWHRVEQGIPPDIDGSESAARYLAHTYPWHRDEPLAVADPALDVLASELRLAEADALAAGGRVDTLKNAIKAVLGETPGVQGAGYRITWKRSADYERTDWKAAAAEFIAAAPERGEQLLRYAEANTVPVEGSRRFVATFEEQRA